MAPLGIGTQIDQLTISNQDVDVYVSKNGTFSVYRSSTSEDDTALGSARTLEDAIQKAKTTIAKRKVKVNIPFYTQNGKAGRITGRHGGNGKILVRVNGESSQWSDYTKVIKPDAPIDSIERIKELLSQQNIIADKLSDLYRGTMISVGDLLAQATEDQS